MKVINTSQQLTSTRTFAERCVLRARVAVLNKTFISAQAEPSCECASNMLGTESAVAAWPELSLSDRASHGVPYVHQHR